MLRNFFKTATRNILKHKTYSIINFIGLTSGLALALLIFTYVRSEISYDQFHINIDRLYRLAYKAPSGPDLATTPPPIGPALPEYFPEVEAVARVYQRNVSITLPQGKEAFEENSITFVDSAFTKMFTLEWVKGNPVNALHEKFTVIITEEMALKYFGDRNPIGEELIFSGRQAFKIIGVVKDFPENSHLRFNMLVTYDDMFDIEDQPTEDRLRANLARNFIISHSYTYVLLKPGTTIDNMNSGMDAFLKKYADPRYQVGQVFSFMAVANIHLESTLLAEPTPTSSMATILIFIGIGFLTLVIAAINYINLSTAQSLTRIKEIGIRKIMGSMRYQLISQFLMESFLFCLISMLLAYVIFDLTLPVLNLFTGKELLFVNVVDRELILASLGLLVIMTALAGGYPAYFVTSFESISALKGTGLPGEGRQLFRKALVVFQLVIACMMLSVSMVIIKQLNYLENRPLGFNRDQVVTIPLFSQNLNGFFRPGDSTHFTRLESFRTIVEEQSGIQSTTLSSGAPGLGVVFRGAIPDGFTREDNLFVGTMSVDYEFIKTFDLELVAGRSFSRAFGTDEREAYIINEAAVKQFNWGTAEQALGKQIDREGRVGKVIGVIKDFNFTALTTPIAGVIVAIEPSQYNTLSVRFDNDNIQTTVDKLEAEWNRIFPEKAFEFAFLDEQIDQQYQTFQNFGKIFQAFTLIAILISCLGVYGLVLFSVKRKIKEIGVRKVLGAHVSSIVLLIYRDFALLIGLGFLFAIPISYYMSSQWLENFIYHTTIDWVTYAISLVVIAFIVTATISYQAITAAQANPVNSLRSE